MILVLEDGAVFRGVSFGAEGEVCGWVHDDHRVVGYQEILTDPDNAGCLLNMTYPLIGNYGVNEEDSESGSIQTGALIVKEKSRIVSNWRRRRPSKRGCRTAAPSAWRRSIPAPCPFTSGIMGK